MIFDDIANKITDGEHLRPNVIESGVPFLSAKDIQDKIYFNDCLYISEVDAKKFQKKCNPEFGDLLFISRGATVGRVKIVDVAESFCLLASVILVKLKKGNIEPKFFEYYFKRQKVKSSLLNHSNSDGASAQPAIYIQDVRGFAIEIPNLSTQRKIVSELDAQMQILEGLRKMKTSAENKINQVLADVWGVEMMEAEKILEEE